MVCIFSSDVTEKSKTRPMKSDIISQNLKFKIHYNASICKKKEKKKMNYDEADKIKGFVSHK